MTYTGAKNIAKPNVPTLEQFISLINTQNLARQERFFVNFPMTTGETARNLTLLCEQASIPGINIESRTLRINAISEQRAHTVNYGNEITLQFLVDADWKVREYMENWMRSCVSHPSAGNEVGYYSSYALPIQIFSLNVAGIPGEALFNWSPTRNDLGFQNALNSVRNKNKTLGIPFSKGISSVAKKVDQGLATVKSGIARTISPLANPLIEAFRDTEKISYSIELIECWPKSINPMVLGYDAVGVERMSVTFAYKYWHSQSENPSAFESFVDEKTKQLSDRIRGVVKKNSEPFDVMEREASTFKTSAKNTINKLF